MKILSTFLLFSLLILQVQAQKPRARDIGIPFEGTPGPYNAITDVKGVEVGYSTIIAGQGQNIQREKFTKVVELPNDEINPLFDATVQAVEEAIINAMVAAETMEGINGNKAYALPQKKVMELLRKYGRVK